MGGGDGSEVGPRGFAGLLVSPLPSGGVSRRSQGGADPKVARWHTGLAETGGFRSPTPGKRPPCRSPYPLRFPVLYQGCDLSTRRTGWTPHPWTETKGRALTPVSMNLVITGFFPALCSAAPGSSGSKMLGGSVNSEARISEPSLTCQDPVTKGVPHQDLLKPSQPGASGSAPSRPRRRPPPQRPHRCPDCPKAFSYPSKLATHRLAHGGTRPHPCPDCPKAFSYPSKLAAHRLTHSGARPHPCPHCPKAFGHRSKLAAHLWTHAPARPYPCPDCPKSFCYPSKLAAHRHTHHATEARPYPCPHCPKAFSFPSKLAAHRLCHDPPTAPSSQTTGNHRCSSCDQAFGQRRLLLVHQRSHHQSEGQGERE
nr:zinc finger protein 575 isoform X1 [Peromyscus maniculatus bairdii]